MDSSDRLLLAMTDGRRGKKTTVLRSAPLSQQLTGCMTNCGRKPRTERREGNYFNHRGDIGDPDPSRRWQRGAGGGDGGVRGVREAGRGLREGIEREGARE